MNVKYKIAGFLRRNIGSVAKWPKDSMLSWLDWHFSKNSIAVVFDGSKIIAVGIARPIEREDVDPYQFKEGSETIYVDQAACKSKRSLTNLLICLKSRYPYAKYMMYRHAKSGIMKQWDFEKFILTSMKTELGRNG